MSGVVFVPLDERQVRAILAGLALLEQRLQHEGTRNGASRNEVAASIAAVKATGSHVGDCWRNGRATATTCSDGVSAGAGAALPAGWCRVPPAAEALGVSLARVRLIAQRLGGIKDAAGEWLIPLAGIERYRAQRDRRNAA